MVPQTPVRAKCAGVPSLGHVARRWQPRAPLPSRGELGKHRPACACAYVCVLVNHAGIHNLGHIFVSTEN